MGGDAVDGLGRNVVTGILHFEQNLQKAGSIAPMPCKNRRQHSGNIGVLELLHVDDFLPAC